MMKVCKHFFYDNNPIRLPDVKHVHSYLAKNEKIEDSLFSINSGDIKNVAIKLYLFLKLYFLIKKG